MGSPNHRMLMAGSSTQLLFGETEVLIAAKHLVGRPGICNMQLGQVSYVHLMFERHEILLADGSWTESFQPGDQTLGGFGQEQRDEIFQLFPSLAEAEGRKAYGAARSTLKRHEAKAFRASL
jgi:hypothetical protein